MDEEKREERDAVTFCRPAGINGFTTFTSIITMSDEGMRREAN